MNQNQNQKCIYSILTKSVNKVTMKRFRIRGPLDDLVSSFNIQLELHLHKRYGHIVCMYVSLSSEIND